jgi:hypothetical protein
LTVSVFGVRHHGPGSARSLVAGLRELRPDAVLVEGPPEGDAVVELAGHPAIRPPVALLVHPPDAPGRAAFYPFATFSPEWQAIRYALDAGVPVRFIDLPVANQLAREPEAAGPDGGGDDGGSAEPASPLVDPIGWLAGAAGEPDAERWWDRMVEQRASSEGVFAAIAEAMTALREHAPEPSPPEARREAHMRQAIRAAVREGHERIAVVCGAWHVPALERLPPAAGDARLLTGLPRVKVQATWIPWTHGRLALRSGYGAGVESPGWYHHLWTCDGDVAAGWLTRVARMLRDEDLDGSPAQVIDAVRLAETLATLRGRSAPGLAEVTEGTLAALCAGEPAPLRLIERRLVVGEELGQLPPDAPVVPLQRDLERQQRRLRLKVEAAERVVDLDLRTPSHLEISHLLHRLGILGIPWGRQRSVASGRKGTFHEVWQLAWRPELALAAIEAAVWGSTVEAAAEARACDRAARSEDLAEVAGLVDAVLLAGLGGAIGPVIDGLRERSTLATDVIQLMAALEPLVSALRYGTVRQTDATLVRAVVEGLFARTVIGLGPACAGLDDAAARTMAERLLAVTRALAAMDDEATGARWREALGRLLAQEHLHGLVAGRCCRLLLDARAVAGDEAARRLGLALSRGAEPAQAAAWFEGFLSGGGMVMLADEQLFGAVDAWLCGLTPDAFDLLLPLLRRTVSTFAIGERRQIGERVRTGAGVGTAASGDAGLSEERAALVEPVLELLLGGAP